jgi:phage-related protein
MANQSELSILVKLKDEASKGLGLLSDGLQTIGVGALAAGAALGGIAVAAIKEFSDAQKGVAQLEAVLESTHGAAGLFKEDILDQAAALQRMTTYTDDAILGAQNLLLTFTNIKGPIFQESIGTILDMSTALGQDLKSSAIQVGKALQDPIEGVSALRRVGVNFSESQQQMIEKLVESGKTMEAQRFILAELASEFGGSAAAQANTFAGKLEQLKNAGSDLLEVIGEPLVNALTPVISKFVEFAQSITVQEKLEALVGVINKVIQVLTEQVPQAISSAINSIRSWINDIIANFDAFFSKVMENQLVIGFLEILKQAFEVLWLTIKDDLYPELQQLWNTIETQLWPALQNLLHALEPLLPLFEAWLKVISSLVGAGLVVLITALTGLLIIVTKVLQIVVELVDFFATRAATVITSITGLVMQLVESFKSVVDWIVRAINAFNQWKSSGASLNPLSSSFKLPGFADGGIVTRPTLAMVGEGGEPEAIIPFSKMGGLGGNVSVVINVGSISDSSDIRELADRVSQAIVDKMSMNQRLNV